MNLQDKYDQLYNDATFYIKNNNVEIDSLINSSKDSRYGITLLIRPDKKVKKKIQNFIEELKLVEPNQYYYPPSDIHLTILSIISCYNGFILESINISDYVAIIAQALESTKIFEIKFTGITASPSCVMIQGFPNNSLLNDLRNNLRSLFNNRFIEQSLDKRYEIQTAHLTVARFMNRLEMKSGFLDLLEKYREYEFGTTSVDSVELVGNDWYQRKEKVMKLGEFQICK